MKKETVKPKVSVVKVRGQWKVRFEIEQQGFFIETEKVTQKEARWFASCLKTALMKLYDNDI